MSQCVICMINMNLCNPVLKMRIGEWLNFYFPFFICGAKLASVSQTRGNNCECSQSYVPSFLIHYIQLCIDSTSQNSDWDKCLCLLFGFQESEHSGIKLNILWNRDCNCFNIKRLIKGAASTTFPTYKCLLCYSLLQNAAIQSIANCLKQSVSLQFGGINPGC